MHSTMFEIRLERTVCLAALCVFLAWGYSSPSKTVEPTDVADDGAAEDIFGDIRSGDGSTDTGPVLERCEPGTYIEAKDGQCYLCNLEGDGVAGRGAEMDDLNPCTEDFCDPVDGVTHEFNSAPCDDGSPDTINDTCVDGVCTGEALVCTAAEYYESEGTCLLCNAAGTGPDGEGDAIDDDDVCTDDVCNDASGVAHTFNNEPCDDGDSETTNDVCIEGVCSGTPVTCEAGTQYEVDGKCYLCNDNGTGSVGTGKNLDDGNPCTDDVCHVEDGVVHPFNSAPCDDGNPGTIEDTCEQGLCVGTTMPCQPALHYKSGPLCKLCNDDGSGSVGEGALIDDDDVCTDDICSPAAGVTHYFNQSACDDGDDETINDTCNQGVCAGTAVTCAANDYFAADGNCHLCNGDGTGTVGESETINDGNPCTDDSCDSGLGVQHLFNSVPCNDGDPGTTGDVCDQGQCTGTPITCPAGEWFEEGSDAVDTDFVARLCDVYPDERSIVLCDGVIRARLREGMDREVMMQPGKVYEFEIDMGVTSNVFRPGHRLRLEVTSSCFPRWNRNLNTGAPIATDTEIRLARQTVHHSRACPSRVILPVVGD